MDVSSTFRSIVRAMIAVAGVAGVLLSLSPAQAQTRWINGRWFDDERFVERTMYTTKDGRLATRRPAGTLKTVDLVSGYVVPAYGDAHHHGIDGAVGLDAKIAAFLRDGIFYVKNPNVIPDLLTPEVRSRINRPVSIDVAFANGGLTSTGAHPGPLHDALAARGVFPGLTREDMPGRGYFVVDDEIALATAWPTILKGKPDFIKVFLNGAVGGPDGGPAGTRAGLAPKVLRSVVKRAHRAGLRVTAHVETAADVATAVRAGVDELAHMPQIVPRATRNPEAYRIAPEVAAEAARRGITVVATASVHSRMHGGNWSDEVRSAIAALQRENLMLLREHGVEIAVGTDGISGETPFATAREEIEYLGNLGFADARSLLRMWAVDTPTTIFPGRKIGRLRSGYEANFLVLEGDPLADPANLHRIRHRVKGGSVLPIE